LTTFKAKKVLKDQCCYTFKTKKACKYTSRSAIEALKVLCKRCKVLLKWKKGRNKKMQGASKVINVACNVS